MNFLKTWSWWFAISMSAALLSAGCGDNTLVVLTEPPQIPAGYTVFYAMPQGAVVFWKNKPDVMDGNRLVSRDKRVVPNKVVRVGVQKGVIFGIHEDPKTRAQSAYYVDTNTHMAQLDIPVSELNDRLKATFGITDFETVPSYFYAENVDGGPR